MTTPRPPETDWRHTIRQAWLGRGVLACALWPLSLGYGALVRLRQWLYQHGLWHVQHLPVPVIVVGNVLVGGVGKTPVVIALVEHCQRAGRRVGVISRGYGRQGTGLRAVLPNDDAREVGDEPLLIARRTGAVVWVGADRVAAARALLAAHPTIDLIISDDGLQHLALARDLTLCVFDERGVGNGWLLPAGPLREPWPRASSSAAPCLVLLSTDAGTDLPTNASDALPRLGPGPIHRIHRHLAPQAQQADGTQRALQDWSGQAVQALAGIAKPERFFSALRQHGLTLQRTQALPDHAPLQDVTIDPQAGDCFCTEKDAVKLWPRHPNVWAVPLNAQLPSDLCGELNTWLQAHPPQPRRDAAAPL